MQVFCFSFYPALSGGPLDSDYELWQFHAHWGAEDGCGSEHTVDGKTFDAELHLVHWNKKYENPNLAAAYPDGLCVLGLFMQIGSEHSEFEKIVQGLLRIQNKNERFKVIVLAFFFFFAQIGQILRFSSPCLEAGFFRG